MNTFGVESFKTVVSALSSPRPAARDPAVRPVRLAHSPRVN